MKHLLKKSFILVMIALFLAACGSTASPAAEENPQATLSALQGELNAAASAQTSLEQENETLQAENETLSAQVTDLESQVSQLTGELQSASDSMETARAESLTAADRTQQLYDLFITNENDVQGEFVLCGNAYEVEFGYVDNLAMRKELAEYEADLTGTIAVNIETRHEKIWINREDGMVWVLVKGLWYPFLVRYDDDTFASKNSVYSLTSGCYLDFPAMEESLQTIMGN